VFGGLEDQSSRKILDFPKFPFQKATTMAHPPGLYAKLLPFIAQTCPSDPRCFVHVYMSFQFHHGRFQVQFLEKDLQTILPRTLNLATAEEVIALADRGGGLSRLEGRQALDLAIANGSGGVFLSLTADQYSKLQMHSRPTASAGSREHADVE
jgi:hypothetical protein